MCQDVYGYKFDQNYIKKAIRRTNMMYGGRNLRANNVFLLNGSIDPWHALGLINYQYQNTTSVYMKGTAHCADMYPLGENDKPDLRRARNLIVERIKLFLE